MASGSPNGSGSPQSYNILGSVCRDALLRHHGSIGDALVHIECGEGDYRLVLRDCVATIAVDVNPTTDPTQASVEGTTSGTDGQGSASDSGQQSQATEAVSSASHTSLRASFDACVDCCVTIADDHLLSCDLPPWVKPCAQWIVRCLMDIIVDKLGLPTLSRDDDGLPSRADLKKLIATSRTPLSAPPPIQLVGSRTTSVAAGISTSVLPTQVEQQVPSGRASSRSCTALHVPHLQTGSPTVLSSSNASTIGLRPLCVKDDCSVVSADYAHKQASSLLGKPLPDEFILNITNVGSYARWRATICSAIDHFECSRQVSAVIVLRCLREPLRSRVRKKVPISVAREEGHVAIIKVLDVSNMTRLEMRAIDQQWRTLQQRPQEAIPAFAERVEDVAHTKETLTGIPISNAEMSERLADGLTDADSIMAKSVVDPLLRLPYEEFKQSMLSFLESKNGHNQLIPSSIQRQSQQHQPQVQGGPVIRPDANQKTMNAKVHSAAAVELGLDSNACIRCGLKGHHASSCTTGSIHRQHERCGRCGKLTVGDAGKNHRCNRSQLQCSRCKKAGHLSGVCRRGLSGGKPSSTSRKGNGSAETTCSLVSLGDDCEDDSSGLHVVETHTAKAVISKDPQASCLSATTSFVNSLPQDPTIEIRVGTAKRYCPLVGLVDSGANISLINSSTISFLSRNGLIEPSSSIVLPSPISIKFGDGKLLSSSTLVTLHCSFNDAQLSRLPLQFLVVSGCQPPCILGRNLFSDLGIRMVSDHGIQINGLSTPSSNGAESMTNSMVDRAGHCARSAAIRDHYPEECTPLIDVVQDPSSNML